MEVCKWTWHFSSFLEEFKVFILDWNIFSFSSWSFDLQTAVGQQRTHSPQTDPESLFASWRHQNTTTDPWGSLYPSCLTDPLRRLLTNSDKRTWQVEGQEWVRHFFWRPVCLENVWNAASNKQHIKLTHWWNKTFKVTRVSLLSFLKINLKESLYKARYWLFIQQI